MVPYMYSQRKYLRLDDQCGDPDSIWELLTKHWDLKFPNLVISVTGGDICELKENRALYQKFMAGIMKTAVKTSTCMYLSNVLIIIMLELVR